MPATVQVPLAPDYFEYRPDLGFSEDTLLTHGPMLARSRDATRWHRPRSGRWHPPYVPSWPDGRVSYSYWCGQAGGKNLLTADSLPDGDDACATCEGRALGAGYPSSVLPPTDRLLFTPTKPATPRQCPGAAWVEFGPGPWPRSGVCAFCGSTERLTGGYRGYGWSPVRLAAHTPAVLVPPCPNHGWLSMRIVEGRAMCLCRTNARELLRSSH